MKIAATIGKILAAVTAIAGAVYLIATYGDQIVAWAKKILGCECACEEAPAEECCCAEGEECCCGEECACEEQAAEECCCECACEEAVAEEAAPAEEAPAEEVATEADFAE